MNNFDEWFKSEMPNTYAKKDSEKIEALVYSVALSAWNVQQTRIDALQNRIDEAWNELDDRNSKEDIIEAVEKILKGDR